MLTTSLHPFTTHADDFTAYYFMTGAQGLEGGDRRRAARFRAPPTCQHVSNADMLTTSLHTLTALIHQFTAYADDFIFVD